MKLQELYEQIRSYFTEPDAELAKTFNDEHEETDCSYRTPEGRKCAVGCTIPDELYDEEFEGNSFSAIVGISLPYVGDTALKPTENATPASVRLREFFFGGDDEQNVKLARFLSAAQHAHDRGSTETADEFVKELDVLARQFGLKVATA